MSNQPRHVAIIMDGNTRWAHRRLLPSIVGHRSGLETLQRIIYCAQERELEALTLFAFSSENWRRPQNEVSALLKLFLDALQREVPELGKRNIRIRFIGALEAFPQRIQDWMQRSETMTCSHPGMTVCAALNYGGQWDIVQACRKLAKAVEDGKLTSEDINQSHVASALSTVDLPPLDLCIRTSGEYRISNFLLWQMAYSELYFSPKLWPDFTTDDFKAALDAFVARERRFGGSSRSVTDQPYS